MPELRTGFDYHLAEVQKVTLISRRKPNVSYFAACDACGWRGPNRDTKGAAEDDAAAHDVTENE